MLSLDFETLVEDESYLVDLGHGVWLMDDHRWALKVWETQRKNSRYALVHADYHWDGCYDFHELPDEEARLLAASPKEIASFVAEGKLIRFDSFIAPAIKRRLVQTIHFYCLQQGMGDDALNEAFLSACGAQQVIHTAPHSLAAAQIPDPLIFDLCLDLFNRTDTWAKGDLWSDKEVLSFLVTVRPLIRRAELVTVSMSFNYSGTESDTRHLAGLVVPEILRYRE
jgi:hypothetical protein